MITGLMFNEAGLTLIATHLPRNVTLQEFMALEKGIFISCLLWKPSIRGDSLAQFLIKLKVEPRQLIVDTLTNMVLKNATTYTVLCTPIADGDHDKSEKFPVH